jgi:hypothetical protein
VLPLETGLRRNILITFERCTRDCPAIALSMPTSYNGSPTTVKTRFISVRFGGTKQERKLGAGVIIHILFVDSTNTTRKVAKCEKNIRL